MNPTQIKEVLQELGGGANKRLGQHFLVDPSALEAIVEAADVQARDRILEIGPGLGVLTRALSARGAEVIAIERDRRYVEYLNKHLEQTPKARIVAGDAAELHWHELIENQPWKFVSNLPYSITSFAIRKALWAPLPPANIVVLIQREVAERIVAKNNKTSLLSLMVALSSSQLRLVKHVPAGAFFPPPKVESAVLQILPLSWQEREQQWGIHPDQVMALAKKGFAHPRKLLASNLDLSIGQRAIFSELGLSERVRAEDVSVKQWTILAQRLSNV